MHSGTSAPSVSVIACVGLTLLKVNWETKFGALFRPRLDFNLRQLCKWPCSLVCMSGCAHVGPLYQEARQIAFQKKLISDSWLTFPHSALTPAVPLSSSGPQQVHPRNSLTATEANNYICNGMQSFTINEGRHNW